MEKRSMLIIAFVFVVIGIVSIIVILCYSNKNDYKKAKNECISFLNENLEELTSIVEERISSKLDKYEKYKDTSYDYHKDYLSREYIQFDIGAQGMLGGQYWGIIYSLDDLLEGKDIEIYDEKEYTGEGNNIFIKEKIKDNWYFYYNDFDGHIDINKIKS